MKRRYPGAPGKLSADKRAAVAQANQIITEYQAQGFDHERPPEGWEDDDE